MRFLTMRTLTRVGTILLILILIIQSMQTSNHQLQNIQKETATSRRQIMTEAGGGSKDILGEAVAENTLEATNKYDINVTRVGLVSYCSGSHYDRLRELVHYNRMAYAHSFDDGHVSIFDGEAVNGTMPYETFISPGAWLKAAYLYQLLLISSSIRKATLHLEGVTRPYNPGDLSQVDWFIWMDCDTLFGRFDLSIPQLLQQYLYVQPHHHIIVAEDFDEGSPFNTGVMFIRNNEWSLQLFHNALRLAEKKGIRNHIYWEQYALHKLYKDNSYDEREHFRIVQNRSIFNAFHFAADEYIDGESLIWHRVGCRVNSWCCARYSSSFFCDKMPQQQHETKRTNGLASIATYATHPRVNEICNDERIPKWPMTTEEINCQ